MIMAVLLFPLKNKYSLSFKTKNKKVIFQKTIKNDINIYFIIPKTLANFIFWHFKIYMEIDIISNAVIITLKFNNPKSL